MPDNNMIKDAVCVVIINLETGQLLMVSRKNDHKDMGWPGGKVDDEDYEIGPMFGLTGVEYAAIRECYEETSLVVNAMVPVFYGMGRTRMVTTFLALSWSGKPTSSEEGVVKWGDIDELYAGTYGAYNRLLVREIFKILAARPDLMAQLKSNSIVELSANEER
jgi:8-oxo-dGTP pyrophosphatase MutT (NUDIX family)